MPVLYLLLALGVFFLSHTNVVAATYYISTTGDDGADGISRETAWKTMKLATSKLKAGDTLFVGDGAYFEDGVTLFEQASEEENVANPITIQAENPGMAVLHGDRRVGPFQKTKGYKNIYETTCPGPVRAVIDADTDCVFEEIGSLHELDRQLAAYHYDKDSKTLYVHSAAHNDPNENAIKVVRLSNGFHFVGQKQASAGSARSFIVDGITIRGYRAMGLRGDNIENLTVQNCNIYHNTYGIYLDAPNQAQILNNFVFSNNLPRDGSPEQAGICITGQCGKVMINGNLAVNNRANNIRAYSATVKKGGNVSFKNNISIGEGPFWVKPDFDGASMTHNVSEGMAASRMLRRNTIGSYGSENTPESDVSFNLIYGGKEAEAKFVDPAKYDFRLQSDSPFRGSAPSGGDLGAFDYMGDVYFVKPNGSDSAEGTAVSLAWKTLSKALSVAGPGDTIYVLSGTYAAATAPPKDGIEGKPIRIRARGDGRVIVDGRGSADYGIEIKNRKHLSIEGLEITGCKMAAISLKGATHIEIKQCLLTNNPGHGIDASNVSQIVMEDNVVAENRGDCFRLHEVHGPVRAVNNIFHARSNAALIADASAMDFYYGNFNCLWGAVLAKYDGSNLKTITDIRSVLNEGEGSISVDPRFANPQKGDFRLAVGSPCRGRGFLEKPIGNGAVVSLVPDPSIQNVEVSRIGDADVTITFDTPATPGYGVLRYGEGGHLDREILLDGSRETFHVMNIAGLQPGTEYSFQAGLVHADKPWLEIYRKEWIQGTPAPMNQRILSEVKEFETGKSESEGRIFYVSQIGDDNQDGLTSDGAWRTLRKACMEARAGDTVIVGPGEFYETLEPLNTGTEQHPIIFRSEPPRGAILDGRKFLLPVGVRLIGKQNIIIDGFVIRRHRASDYETRVVRPASSQVFISKSKDCEIRNCLIDGGDIPPSTSWKAQMGVRVDGCGGIAILDNMFVSNTWQIWISGNPLNRQDIDIENNTFLHTYIWGIHITGNQQKLRLRNNLFVEHPKNKTGLPYIRFTGVDGRIDSNFNAFYFYPSTKPNVVIGPVNGKLAGNPSDLLSGGLELEKWHREFSQDEDSLKFRFGSDRLEEFREIATANGPYSGQGEDGADIGCSWMTGDMVPQFSP